MTPKLFIKGASDEHWLIKVFRLINGPLSYEVLILQKLLKNC